ncbi:3-keto-5-aminohexanoate cleavage protein [Nocardia sp. NBC_00508]|uniref:3-keto-5-aminohexanoate cleavage protein n=1 Tax=Nocardia sp. NBC_00508 TaxID=2975992 RepID=UPI002E816651|nr:3-keto-5-aminohexanoate cleavage protein [Nocardia sp. NBC_00508]WUD65183.1 3-keto-5-aminohexanoate cleavage protein [Nocardia sp. NBC_00508]
MTGRKVIVTVAPTGGLANKADNPNLPTQPHEIAADVLRCYNAGASIAALHARRQDDEATCDPAVYRETNTLIRARCDIVINNSTGGGVNGDLLTWNESGYHEVSWAQRLRGLDGGADMCTLDAMTCFASVGDREVLLATSPSRGRELAEGMRAKEIKPEWEAFGPTHLAQEIAALIGGGYDSPPYFVNLVFGLDRVFQGALPYSPKNLQLMVDLLPQQSLFTVSAVGEPDTDALVHALLLGGHVRVGLEDNLRDAGGKPTTNLAAVQRIVRIVRELGMEPATAAEAREMLGLERL